MSQQGERRNWWPLILVAALLMALIVLELVRAGDARRWKQEEQEAVWQQTREEIFCSQLRKGMSREDLELVLDRVGPHNEDVSDFTSSYSLRVLFDDPRLEEALGPAHVPFFEISRDNQLENAWYGAGFEQDAFLCPSIFPGFATPEPE